jgi:hypothetical protein
MYVIPEHPERGAWLIVQRLWPALQLKDTAGMDLRLIRQVPAVVPEVKHVR